MLHRRSHEQRMSPAPGQRRRDAERDEHVDPDRPLQARPFEGVGQLQLDHAEHGERGDERDVHGRETGDGRRETGRSIRPGERGNSPPLPEERDRSR